MDSKKEQETKYDNLDMCLIAMEERIIEKEFHTGGIITMGRVGFGLLMGLDILDCIQRRYGIPSTQEEDDVFARFDIPMNRNDPQKSWCFT